MRILSKVLALLVMTTMVLSCTKSTDSPETNNTITDIASRKSNLKIFTQALNITGLATIYRENGERTLFAPSDDAFTAYCTAKGYTTINDIPVNELKNLVLYHQINGTLQTSQLTTGYVKSHAFGAASSNNTLSLYIDTTQGIKINGISSVVTSNIIASNGAIHIVDTVLELPTLAVLTNANLNLSTLATTLALPSQSAILGELSSASVYSVFAPTNAAFTALDTELNATGGIAAISDTDMSKILSYHIINGNILSDVFTDGMMITTLLPLQSITFQVSNQIKIKDVKNRITNVTVANIQCTNGVLYIVDNVFLPNL
jgi:uncharacterized surface protein with fasciclin (FAS1) repeats